MESRRRELLAQIAAGCGLQSYLVAAAASKGTIKALAFDGFAVFNPLPVYRLAEELFPGKGLELSGVWRTRQFEYMWLRTLSARYSDFLAVTGDALVFAAKAVGVELTSDKRERLMNVYLKLPCWPEAPRVLHTLRKAGLRLSLLSNMTQEILKNGIRNSQLDGVFEHVLSTDRVQAYKPDGRAYQMGIDAFGSKRGQVLFVASAGWDAAGAKIFGYPTYWVNRQNQPGEELGATADAQGGSLDDLAALVLR